MTTITERVVAGARLHGWRLLEWASRHGFITDDEDAENWADLTAEWKRVITERRATS